MAQHQNIVSQFRQDRKILWIAIACGLLAAVLISFQLRDDKADLVPVLVASETIATGGIISEATAAIQYRPSRFASAGRIDPQDFKNYGELESTVHIEPGTEILWSFIRTGDSGTSLSKALDSEYDMRLVTIAVNEVKGLAGNIRQNDLVDILWTGTIPGPDSRTAPAILTRVLLEGVVVASVNRSGAGSQGFGMVPSSVTLKLSQDEAALLTFSESVGNVTLLLRHQSVLPENLSPEKSSIEIGYEDIKRFKTISRNRLRSIEVTYGRDSLNR